MAGCSVLTGGSTPYGVKENTVAAHGFMKGGSYDERLGTIVSTTWCRRDSP